MVLNLGHYNILYCILQLLLNNRFEIDKSSLNEQITLGFANNIRFEENKDLPSNSNLGDKVSDFVGLFEYKPDENLKFNYDFSLKNNLISKNYELFGFEFYLDNFTSKVEYLNENNSNSKTSYLQNETRYKFNENNSLIFETRENKEKSFTEFYNLIYEYKNDCLSAAIEYNKEYYIMNFNYNMQNNNINVHKHKIKAV